MYAINNLLACFLYIRIYIKGILTPAPKLTQEDIIKYCDLQGLTDKDKDIMISICFYPNGRYKTVEEIWGAISNIQTELIKNNEKPSTFTADSIPKHYTKNKGKVQYPYDEPINFIEHFNMGFSLGNCIKYFRYRLKGGVKDLEKIKFYTDMVINGSYQNYERYAKGV